MSFAQHLIAGLLATTPLIATAHPPDPTALTALQSSSLSFPDSTQLEANGARIGQIEIDVEDVFEADTHLTAPYRLANGLHVNTKQGTVAEQLLFHTGDRYQRRVLDETARLLRGRRYFSDASIEPTRYNEDNTVDVVVRVHDVWTFSPGVSFGRKGGANSGQIEFEETNLFGWGKQVQLSRSSNVDRAGSRLDYKDPNLLGSRWRLETAYARSSDGEDNAFNLGRPFYSLDSRWSATANASDSTLAVGRYALGREVDRFQMQRQSIELGGGRSRGLQRGRTQRYLAGARYEQRKFASIENETTLIPADRVQVYPWLGYEVVSDGYITTRNLEQIGRTEDLYLGSSLRLEAGYASRAFGSTENASLLHAAAQTALNLGLDSYFITAAALDGRLERSSLRDGLLDINSRYLLRQSAHRVFFASARAQLASNLDPEHQLLLGGDTGLRGYPLRYQGGSSNALFTLEEHLYTDWQLLKLFNVGGAVFFDVGRAWGDDPVGAAHEGWLKDVGLGLRLGNARSSLGNVLHIDLAFPLDRTHDIHGMQLLIETRRSF